MIHERRYDPFAFVTYDKFQLYQYKTNTTGLYYSSGQYIIYCPELGDESSPNVTKQNLIQWLEENKILGTNITISNTLPVSAIQIDDLRESLILDSAGYLITRGDIENEIDLLIPNYFENYIVTFNGDSVNIAFAAELSDEKIEKLNNIFTINKFPIKFSFSSTTLKVNPKTPNSFFPTIRTFRSLSSNLTGNLRDAWENDEDQWVKNRNELISSDSLNSVNFKPQSLQNKTSRCLVDCGTFLPDNIRNYISLYEEVCLALPKKDNLEATLNALGIKQSELIELVALGRVQILAPKSIEFYDNRLLEDLLVANKSHMHFTRLINTMTIAELKKRNPLYFPVLETVDKRQLLSAIDDFVESLELPTEQLAKFKKTIAKTGHGWVSLPNAFNQFDSEINSSFGIINLIEAFFPTTNNVNMGFRIAAPAVDWAAATGSILVPADNENIDLVPYSSAIANLYSGVPSNEWILQKPDYANFAAEGILSISKHIPILELAQTFNGSEINRFRKMILSISQNQPNLEELQNVIETYNYWVKQYENKKDNLATWNIRGFVLSILANTLLPGVTFASWGLNVLLRKVLKESPKNELVGALIDKLDANIHGSYPDAVLISKMKDRIRKKL